MPPTDGSTPSDYDAITNFSYFAYKLEYENVRLETPLRIIYIFEARVQHSQMPCFYTIRGHYPKKETKEMRPNASSLLLGV